MSNIVKWGAYTEEAALREEQEGGGERRDFMKLEVGKNQVRFLPPPIGKDTPFQLVHTHYVPVPGQTEDVRIVCPRKHGGGKCPICAKAEQLYRSGNAVDQDKAGELWPRRRYYAHVINRKNPDAGVVILPMGPKIHDAIRDLRKDPEYGGDFTNPEKGYDIVIERAGTGKYDTAYKVRPAMKGGAVMFGPLNPDPEVMNALIEEQGDLTRLVNILSPEAIVEQLEGLAPSSKPEAQPSGARPAARPKGGTIVDGDTGQVVSGDDLPF